MTWPRSSTPTRRPRAAAARPSRDPGRHHQGLGPAVRRRPDEPRRAAHPARSSTSCATRSASIRGRRVGAASPPGSAGGGSSSRGAPRAFAPPAAAAGARRARRARRDLSAADLDARRRSVACSAALGRLPVGDRIVTVSADVAVPRTSRAGSIARASTSRAREPGPFAERAAGRAVEGVARRPARRARHRRAQPVPGSWAPSASRASSPASAPARSARSTIRSSRRGLDALYHALYAGARFIVAATPSGVSLSPEGGAHQSVITPGIGVALPAIALLRAGVRPRGRVDPARRALRGLAARATARASTCGCRPSRSIRRWRRRRRPRTAPRCCAGGYRLIDARGEPGYDPEATRSHIFAAGVMVPEAVAAQPRAARARACSRASSS